MDAALDIGRFVELARRELATLLGDAGSGAASIYNASGRTVAFFAYGGDDRFAAAPAGRTLIAGGCCGTVAAPGIRFRIRPDKARDHEFLVLPGSAVVYHGPGRVEVVG